VNNFSHHLHRLLLIAEHFPFRISLMLRLYMALKDIIRKFIHPSMVPQPLVRSWPLSQVRNPIHSPSDSLDGGSAHRKAATYTQDSTNTE
jgi:hypothetical protein